MILTLCAWRPTSPSCRWRPPASDWADSRSAVPSAGRSLDSHRCEQRKAGDAGHQQFPHLPHELPPFVYPTIVLFTCVTATSAGLLSRTGERIQILKPRITYFCPNSVSRNAGTSAITDGRRHEVPLHAHLRHELRHHDRDHRHAFAGQDQREQELVPGEQPAQYRERRDGREADGSATRIERSPARAAVDQSRRIPSTDRCRRRSPSSATRRSRCGRRCAAAAGRYRCRRCPSSGHEVERQHPGDVGHAAEHVDHAEPAARDAGPRKRDSM